MSERQSKAVSTGANRGIGFEVCRQLAERNFVVLLTARDAAKARSAAMKLGNVDTVEPRTGLASTFASNMPAAIPGA